MAKRLTATSSHVKQTWTLFACVLVVYLVTASYETGRVLINDSFFSAYPAYTLGTSGTLNIDPIVQYTTKGWAFILDGNLRSDRFPGPILLATPFYAIAGGSTFSLGPSAVVAALTTAVAVALLHRTLLRVVSLRTATGAALLFAFATAAWTVAADGLWTHGPTLMALSLATWALGSQRYAVSGLGYALAILSRPHTAVVAATAGVWESVAKRSWRPVVTIGATSALGFVGLLVYNRINSNAWDIFPGTYGGRIDAATSSGVGGQAQADLWLGDIAATFLSPARGLLVLSPFLILCLPGVVTAWRKAPDWVRSSVVGAGLYLVVQLAGNTWVGASGIFGNRLVLEPLLLATPLLAMSWEAWGEQRRWACWAMVALGGASLWWHGVAAVLPTEDLGGLLPPPAWSEWAISGAVTAASPVAWLGAAVFATVVMVVVTRLPAPRQVTKAPSPKKTDTPSPKRPVQKAETKAPTAPLKRSKKR